MFKLKENKTTLKTEIIAGAIAFVAMCYILPVNATILNDGMGMDKAGVFLITALLSGIISVAMGLIANYPIILSAGMGMNAFLAYTLSDSMGFTSWQQKILLLTVTGLIFLLISLTPIRKKIIEAIPLNLRGIISASLGGFILFVGLKGSGIIASEPTTLVTFGNLLDPAVIIAILGIIIAVALQFNKNELIKNLAIPIGVLFAAVVGVITSTILIKNEMLISTNDGYAYLFNEGHPLNGVKTLLPIGPWNDSSVTFGINVNAFKEVFAFGLFTDSYSIGDFGNDIVKVFISPAAYIAIFSLCFVKIFESTATLIAVGSKAGFIEANGEFKNYKRVIMVDAVGTAISGPSGTSALTPFVESNVAVSLGGKTGLVSVTAGILFLLSAFIYPVFSIFTSGSVTAPALTCVGIMILINSLKDVNFKEDYAIGIVAVITVIMTILTYSIPNGIGFGILAYILTMLVSNRRDEITIPLYIIGALYIVSFALNAIIQLF